MKNVRKIALRRLLILGLGLFTGLALGVYEFLQRDLPAAGFGIVLLLLIIAFLTGISLILRAASRQIRRHLTQAPAATVSNPGVEPISVLALLRNKTQ